MSVDGKIAELILRIQNASDGGKRLCPLVTNTRSYRDNCAGYAQKDNLLIEAINIISKTRNNWKYSVTKDSQGIADYIVYFQTRIMSEKVQISFHSFDSSLSRYVKNSFRIPWDHGCSRDSAIAAYTYYTQGSYGVEE